MSNPKGKLIAIGGAEDKGTDLEKGEIFRNNLNFFEFDNYKNLWHIEKAFRMSKTDLRIRPIYHRLKRRIEAHICLSFTAYAIYKELERILTKEKSSISLKQAEELTHNMYEINIILPESKQTKKILLRMDENQTILKNIIDKIF